MSTKDQEQLLEWFRVRQPRVGVMGLGYVGLPLSLTFAEAGLPVTGFDIDPEKVEMLKRGETYLSTVKPERIRPLVNSRAVTPTSDFTKLSECHAIVICVPTPLNEAKEPDLKYVRMTSEQIAGELKPGQLIVLESSTYPGTTDEIVRDVLERSNLKCGKDFYLAYSPEREDPGNRQYTTATIPKLVGGLDDFSGDLAETLYKRAFRRVIRVSHARVAEAAKLLENIYRSVNIAMVNELKIVFEGMGIDVWEVIAAAATKPFGFQAFYPGPGLGGHCIPIDPFYLSWKARASGITTRFIELAGEINSAMPQRVVRRVQDVLNERGKALKGSRILLLGITYKGGVSDTRESPGLELLHLLSDAGADVVYHDPMAPRITPTRRHDFHMDSVPLTSEAVRSVDVVLMVTNHEGVDLGLVAEHARVIVDTRNAFARFPNAKVVKA